MIWITWENQRRSVELSRAIGSKLYILECTNVHRFFRYIKLSLKTIGILVKERPKVLIVQNPSMILAFLSIILKLFFRYKLVVDRHSNFKYLREKSIVLFALKILSELTIKYADLTIVTNSFLARYIEEIGGNSFILEDKIPKLLLGEKVSLKGEVNVVFVCSYSDDEPINEAVKASSMLPDNWVLYITGNYKNYKNLSSLKKNLPDKTILTGYLNEKDYQSLLVSSDIIMVLTKNEHTLTCGAYEGVSLGKPLVISNTLTLKQYFCRGVIYSKVDSESIYKSLMSAWEKKSELEKSIFRFKYELTTNWNSKFNLLLNYLNLESC